MDKVRVGLVGIGGMGGCHFFNYDSVENAQVVAVCDVREDMAKEKIGERDVKVYTDLKKMLRCEKLDMIDICTPSYLHADMAIACLKKGYHVLCEKPMTLNAKDAKRVLAAVEKTNKNFMVAHVVRFMAPYMYLKDVITSGELGKLIRLDMKRISSMPLWSFEDWMRDVSKSGGVVTDLSIHDLDFVQSVLGAPDKISAIHKEMKDNSEYILTNMFYGDKLITCEGTWYNAKIPFSAKYLAVFENGYVELSDKLVKNGEEVSFSKASADAADLGINIGNDNGYLAEIQYFVNCVANGLKTDLVTPASSAYSVELADTVKKKAQII